MAKVKSVNKKLRLNKLNKQTRWAPFWIVPKINGAGKKVHPGRYTEVKRNWKKVKTKA